jgi:hypothetical protein
METYFAFEYADKLYEAAENSEIGTYFLYGGYHAVKDEFANLIELKKSLKLKNSQVVITIPRFSIPLKKRNNKVILINVNSNHILERNKSRLRKWLIKKIYNSCDTIVCIEKSQIKNLKNYGITSKLIYAPLYIDSKTIDLQKVRREYSLNKYSPYYISSGFDEGKKFDLFNDLDCKYPIVIFNKHNPVKYDKYCWFLAGAKGVVLNIQDNVLASDVSGSTTTFEALCAKIPVFINNIAWVKNFPSKNIHVYKDLKELEKLLNSDITWIEDGKEFYFESYYNKLKRILKFKN